MNFLELAKQGDTEAIAYLINRSLQPKGITVIKAVLKDSCLQIMLEAAQIPDQQSLIALMRKWITTLGFEPIKQVKIYGRKIGEEIPAWSHEFEVAFIENNASPEMNVMKSNHSISKPAPLKNENKTSEKIQNDISNSSQNQKVLKAKPLVSQSVKSSQTYHCRKVKTFRHNKKLSFYKLP